MPFARLTLARVETIAALAFLILALFILYEGMKLGPGWGDSGPQSGFFPFSLAVLVLIGAVVILGQCLLARIRGEASQPFIEDPEEIRELARVGLPMAGAIASIPVLGLYLMSAIYMWLFAWWHGKFRWYTALFAGVVFSAATYLLLAWGFRILMPMSVWRGTFLPV
jgi:putative tricarboxylic transport membrane protein